MAIDQLISDISAKPSKGAAKPKAKKAAGKEKRVVIKENPKKDKKVKVKNIQRKIKKEHVETSSVAETVTKTIVKKTRRSNKKKILEITEVSEEPKSPERLVTTASEVKLEDSPTDSVSNSDSGDYMISVNDSMTSCASYQTSKTKSGAPDSL